ncbi:MAG: hypothetical protein AB7U79_07790 [Candidatus Izemoplasmatales bacterium]
MKVICKKNISGINFDREIEFLYPEVYDRTCLEKDREYDVYAIVHSDSAVFYVVYVEGYLTFLYADHFSIVDHALSNGISTDYYRAKGNVKDDMLSVGFRNLIRSDEFLDFDLFVLAEDKVEYILKNYKI